jgi:hypothetical protein
LIFFVVQGLPNYCRQSSRAIICFYNEQRLSGCDTAANLNLLFFFFTQRERRGIRLAPLRR